MKMLLTCLALAGCGAIGTIPNAERDLRFLRDKAELYVHEEDGLHRLALDGSNDRVVFAHKMGPGDVTDNLHVFAWSDSDTNLWIGDERTGRSRQVPELDGRASGMAFSPDGRTLAVSRHADFSLPQPLWKDDDAIYFVDVETLRVTTIPASSWAWPDPVRYSTDGSVLQLFMVAGSNQWISIADGKRHAGTTPLPPRPDPRPKTSCPVEIRNEQWGTKLEVLEPGKPPRVLVAEVGRKRGFHDFRPDFRQLTWSPSCQTLVYQFENQLWVVDLASGRTGPLAHGWLAFFARP